jgi:hypothetical protein
MWSNLFDGGGNELHALSGDAAPRATVLIFSDRDSMRVADAA